MDLRKIRRVICLQRESSDCGVACLLTLLRFFGAESSMYRLREESGITPSGTSLLALYRTAIRYGLKADAVEASEDWLFQQKDPVLLHVELENQRQHYVIWWQRDQDKSLIFDPACGLVKWSDEKLRTLWKSRYGMRVASGTCREQARQTATGRKQWIRSMVRPYIPAFMVNVTIGLLIAATGISVNLFIQKLIDTWLPDRLLVSLAMASALLLVLLTVRACMAAFRNWMMARVANRMDRRMMAEMYPNLLNKPLSFFEQRKVGDLMSRLADIRRIRTTFTDVIGGSLVINLLLVLSALVGISLYAPLLALFSAVLSLLFFAILWHYSLEIKDRQYAVMSSYAASEASFNSSFHGIRTWKLAARTRQLNGLNQALYGKFTDFSLNLAGTSVRLSFAYEMLSIGILLFALAYGVYGYFASSLTLGGVTSIIGLISILMPSIVELAVIPFRWSEARVALDRVSELLEEVPLGAVSDTMLGPIRMIDFEKVSYGYGADSIMLQDISLHIESGVLFGLTGESGSGKSTLCKLLERSYTPCSGSYMVNGIPAGNFAPETWAARVAVVAQDVYILNGSLLENICLLVDSVQEAERAVELCRRYDFERFFQRFPQGYATLLGESGRKLSGGEKQLIALARALVCQPDFLILDEPTASMDPGMEQFVMNLLTEYKRNSIVLMVSHKSPLLLKYADYAGVLENGRLVCVGTPADLVSSDNFFSRFLQQ